MPHVEALMAQIYTKLPRERQEVNNVSQENNNVKLDTNLRTVGNENSKIGLQIYFGHRIRSHRPLKGPF